MQRLDKLGLATTIKQAKVDGKKSEVWDALEYIIRAACVNKGSTLHRLGVQAFGSKINRRYCYRTPHRWYAAFNADFDGDQMAVRIPLSLEAQLEARFL